MPKYQHPNYHKIQTPENKENVQYYANNTNQNLPMNNNPKTSSTSLVDNINTSGRLSFRAQQQKTKNEPQPVSTSNTGDAFSFLNDYTSFTQKSQAENNKQQNITQSDEDLNKLREQYEILVNKILTEEKDYIESHKKHIDDMVHTMKSEMNLINTVEKQANVDEYVDTLLNVFTSQEEQIKTMKERLINFKSMLKEESELSGKIAKISNEPNTEFNIVDDNIKMDSITNKLMINDTKDDVILNKLSVKKINVVAVVYLYQTDISIESIRLDIEESLKKLYSKGTHAPGETIKRLPRLLAIENSNPSIKYTNLVQPVLDVAVEENQISEIGSINISFERSDNS